MSKFQSDPTHLKCEHKVIQQPLGTYSLYIVKTSCEQKVFIPPLLIFSPNFWGPYLSNFGNKMTLYPYKNNSRIFYTLAC
jgi:hypothetical protein